jgi:hypothetical protein
MILPSKKVLSVFVVIAALVASIIIAFGRDKTSSAVNFASNLVAGDKVSIPENPSWQNELGVVGENQEQIQTESGTTTEETTTDVISRTLIANYLALKQSDKLDNISAQELVDKTLEYIEKSGGEVVKITQLNIIPDNGKETMASYGENLGNILKSNKPKEVKKELEIIKKAAEQLYGEGATIFTQSIRATNSFIIKNNIVYKQNSGGYYLLYGI